MGILTETGRCVNRSGHVDRNAHADRLAVNSCLGVGRGLKVSKQMCLKKCPEPRHVPCITITRNNSTFSLFIEQCN